MYEYKISWSEFKTKLPTLLSEREPFQLDNFLFRGQASANWVLSSSFDRIEKDKSKYKDLIERFISICKNYGYNDDLFKDGHSSDISAYAQHYGLPTRLLDWTKSPYYAAFFAFSETSINYEKGSISSIWAINKRSEALRRRQGIEFFQTKSTKFNYRLKNQFGHFTLSTHSEDSIEKFDEGLVAATGINDLLWRFNIKIEGNVWTILEDLNMMGINYSTVYPDIQGYIKEAVFWSKIGIK